MKLAATEHGDGPAVVVLHGLFGSARNWAGFARRLAAAHRVIALDLRNHGESPWAETMTYAEMADDVARFIADARLDRPTVLGHSMGGKVAMNLALRDHAAPASAPGAVIVVDIAPVVYARGFASYVTAMAALDLAAVQRRADADGLLAGAVPDPVLRGFLLQNLIAGDDGYGWRINLEAIGASLAGLSGFDTPPATSFVGPALFVGGGRSDYLAADHHTAVRRHFPKAEIRVIDDAGHWPHAEQPEAFADIVASFLDQLPS